MHIITVKMRSLSMKKPRMTKIERKDREYENLTKSKEMRKRFIVDSIIATTIIIVATITVIF